MKTLKKSTIIMGILGLAILISISIFVFSRDSKTIEDYLDLGIKYLNEQDYNQAIAAFNEALSIDDMNVDAYIGLSNAYIGKDDVDKAIEILIVGYNKTNNMLLKKRIDELSQNKDIENGEAIVSDDDVVKAEWVDSLKCSFSVDNIILGVSTISEAKSIYNSRSDYMSNLMNDNTYDTVYSMPYRNNPNSNYSEMAFGYIFSAPVSTGIIDHISITDSSISCMYEVRIGDTIDEFLQKIECPLSYDKNFLKGTKYVSSNNNVISVRQENEETIIEYSDGEKYIHCYFSDNQLKTFSLDYIDSNAL